MAISPSDIETKEYELLFAQLRHVETQRSFVFNLFIVISGLIFSYAAKILVDGKAVEVDRYLFFLLFAESLVAFIFYLQIRRMTEVVGAYDDMIMMGRQRFFGTQYPFAKAPDPYATRSRFARFLAFLKIHNLDESMRVLVFLVLIVSVVFQGYYLLFRLTYGDINWTIYLPLAMSVFVAVLVLIDHFAPGQDEKPTLESTSNPTINEAEDA